MAPKAKGKAKAQAKAKALDPAALPEWSSFRKTDEMRGALKLLDLKFPERKQHNATGKWHSLDHEDMQEIYEGRKRHMIAEPRTLEWCQQRVQVLSHRLKTYVGTYAVCVLGSIGES
jgi:hypothetical protein